MNVFATSQHPVTAARWQFDQHVFKMPLETAQLASNVAVRLGAPVPPKPNVDKLYYRPTHATHPCSEWAAQTESNWRWLLAHGFALSLEYTRRRGKRHASEDVLRRFYVLGERHGYKPPPGPLTPFPQAFHQHPECMVPGDPVLGYRLYYVHVKSWAIRNGPPVWTERKPPPWWRRVERYRARMRSRYGHSLEEQRAPEYVGRILPLLRRA